jgi:hypothetical protein
MDAKTALSKSAFGLRGVLVVLSVLSTLVIGLTCLVFMVIALMFCDSCSGIGDWVKGAGLPLGTMGATVLASTVIGITLSARRRWVIGSVCLAVSPGLILVGAVSPTIREASPVFAIAAIPLKMYHDQQHIQEVQRAGESLMAQAGRAIAGPDGPLGEGWRRTDTGQIAIDGLALELCNAAANGAPRQQPALRAKCMHTNGADYTLTVEVRTLKPE